MFRRRKRVIADSVRDVPEGLFCFELLYADGEDLTRLSYPQRRARLAAAITVSSQFRLTTATEVATPIALDAAFGQAVTDGCEGLVCKSVSSAAGAYDPDADVFRAVSKCGTGFSDAELAALPARLAPLARSQRPALEPGTIPAPSHWPPRGGHVEVTCNEPGCSERWQRPLTLAARLMFPLCGRVTTTR